MTRRLARAYHRSPRCKEFVAAKVARLSGLDFLRVPPGEWTPAQRARYEAWYPGDLAVAEECLADPRFPAVFDCIGISSP